MISITETIAEIPDSVLIHVIKHSNDFSWNFLAMKIILTRLNLKMVMYSDSDAVLRECCAELRNLLQKSSNIPNSRSDLKQILSLTDEL